MASVQKKSRKSKGTRKPNMLKVAQEVGIPIMGISEPEFRSITSQLKELTHTIVDAWATRGEIDAFEEVLVKLHAARRNLETACRQIEGAS